MLPSHPFHWLSLPPRLRGKIIVSTSTKEEKRRKKKSRKMT
jgi:hypothetical protein